MNLVGNIFKHNINKTKNAEILNLKKSLIDKTILKNRNQKEFLVGEKGEVFLISTFISQNTSTANQFYHLFTLNFF